MVCGVDGWFRPSIKGCSPSVATESIANSWGGWEVVRQWPNREYSGSSLTWCRKMGPMKTGGLSVPALTSFGFLYAETVKDSCSGNTLKVGSTVKIENSHGFVQNYSKSLSCLSLPKTADNFGCTGTPSTNTFPITLSFLLALTRMFQSLSCSIADPSSDLSGTSDGADLLAL